MRITGLSEFIDPCGTSAMPASRSALIPSSSKSASRVPANHTSPASMRPGGLIIRRIDNAKVDLPEPDSPASPKRSPGIRAKLTSSTACTQPCGWSKPTRKPSTRRTGSLTRLRLAGRLRLLRHQGVIDLLRTQCRRTGAEPLPILLEGGALLDHAEVHAKADVGP